MIGWVCGAWSGLMGEVDGVKYGWLGVSSDWNLCLWVKSLCEKME